MTVPDPLGRPTVSIGLPVRNGAPEIGKALRSLLDQSYTDLELIVSDNASSDDTFAICEEMAAADPRLRLVRQPRDIGAQRNFSFVLDEARGSYFMFAAHDDDWDPAFIRSLLDRLQAVPDAGVAMCAVERTYGSGNRLDRIDYGASPEQATWLQRTLAVARGVKLNLYIYGLYRTEVLRSLWGPLPVEAWDRLFVLRAAMSTRFAYVERALLRKAMRHGAHRPTVAGRLGYLRAATPYVLGCGAIPRRRKLAMPLVIATMLLAAVRDLAKGLRDSMRGSGRPP